METRGRLLISFLGWERRIHVETLRSCAFRQFLRAAGCWKVLGTLSGTVPWATFSLISGGGCESIRFFQRSLAEIGIQWSHAIVGSGTFQLDDLEYLPSLLQASVSPVINECNSSVSPRLGKNHVWNIINSGQSLAHWWHPEMTQLKNHAGPSHHNYINTYGV